MALYEMRTYTLYVGKMAEAQKLYTELVSGAEEGWPRQEPRRVFRRRHGDDQSARAHLEIQG
jgi:hypothetical protein